MAEVVRYPEGRRLILRTGAAAGRAFIRVEDNGPGVPPAQADRMFEPFFTTKEPGRGTGLGLSICRQIAREHGGDVTLENRPGLGCAFTLDLPEGREEEFERLEAVEEPARHPAVPGKRVLVADDEADIADVIARLLREDGDEVLVAHGGAEALKLLSAGEFDLVISDMAMQRITGPDLLRRLTESGSRAKVLFVTGDTLNPKVLNFFAETRSEFLPKPFDIDELRQTARRLLSSGV
jgi:CheY-like chemotaxis protein